jgi:hypothetical protein
MSLQIPSLFSCNVKWHYLEERAGVRCLIRGTSSPVAELIEP